MDLEQYDTRSKIWALVGQSEVSPRAFSGLLTRFHTLDNILLAETDQILEKFDLGDELATAISTADRGLPRAAQFVEAVIERDIRIVTMFDSEYPERFHELNDPPPLLFYRGALPAPEERIVTLVGSSAPSAPGISVAVDFGAKMAARDVSLLTGLARGIDAAALVGATGWEAASHTEPKNGKPGGQELRRGKVYAAATSGLDTIYPDENTPLCDQVIRSGAIFSEYSPDSDFQIEHVGPANRLCVGLAQAVVIGEVFSDSEGALDVAGFCVDLGKLLFVLIPTEQPIADEKAIGVRFPDEIDTVVKCLV